MGAKRVYQVKSFLTELKIFHPIKELEALDDQVNRFIMEQGVRKVVSVGDTPITDPTGASIGLVRVVTYES